MTGDELRAKRNELKLYQGRLAEQLQALGLELPGGQKIDQPAISQMERGRIEIPAEVAAAILGGRVQPGTDAPPPVGQQRDGEQGGRRRRKVTKKAAAAAGEQGTDDGDGDTPQQPSPAAPQPSPSPEPEPRPEQPEQPQVVAADTVPGDRPPTPGPTPPRITWDAATKSQLERDLRDLFAGAEFMVPMRVAVGYDPDGREVHEIREQVGHIPGVAQLAGALGNHDDERIIQLHAASMAHAWAELADENPTVRRFLLGATYGGAWRGVMMATLPVVLGIAGNHGLGLPGFLGGPATAPVALQP